jgi:undecaprenyl-diphosphatase
MFAPDLAVIQGSGHLATLPVVGLLAAETVLLLQMASQIGSRTGRRPMLELIKRIKLLDERALEALTGWRHPGADRLMQMLTRLADPLSVIVIVILMMSAQEPLATAGHRAAFAVVASHAFAQLLKRGVGRRRPRMPEGFAPLVKVPDRFSFPSGHAAAALAIGLPLAEMLPATLGALVLALAAFVGLSRCYLGIHYPCDVFAGWILAIAAHVFDITALP